jgi:hypothetical protein
MATAAVDALKRIVRTGEGRDRRLALVALLKIAPDQTDVKQVLADAGTVARWTAQAAWYFENLSGSRREEAP